MLLTQLARTNRKTLFLFLWMALMPLMISSIISYYAITHEPLIRSFDYTTWALLFLASCLTMGFALTPTTFVALLSGFFLGMEAAPFVVLAYTAASLIGYQLTHFIDNGTFLQTIKQLPGKKAVQIDHFIKGLQGNQFGIIVMARISPVLPFAIMNVVLPIAGVQLKNFIIAGTLGMLPRTLFFIWFGSQAQELRTLIEEGEGDPTAQIVFFILLVISLMGLFYYGRKILQRYMTNQ